MITVCAEKTEETYVVLANFQTPLQRFLIEQAIPVRPFHKERPAEQGKQTPFCPRVNCQKRAQRHSPPLKPSYLGFPLKSNQPAFQVHNTILEISAM